MITWIKNESREDMQVRTEVKYFTPQSKDLEMDVQLSGVHSHKRSHHHKKPHQLEHRRTYASGLRTSWQQNTTHTGEKIMSS